MGNAVEERLMNLGFENTRGNRWLKGRKVVHVMHSSESGRGYVRIVWREEWKGDHAIIYDYSSGGGPVCIVPIPDLFTSDFVKKKRRKASYANSGYWWSQKFPVNHDLVTMVLSFRDRWDLLK